MTLVNPSDFSDALHLKGLAGDALSKLFMRMMKISRLNREYSHLAASDKEAFIDAVLQHLDIKFEVDEEDLAKIPAQGPFITISNHPFGGIDGLLLLKLFHSRRPDYKVIANFVLQRLDPLGELFLGSVPEDEKKNQRDNLSGLREALEHMQTGGCMGLFPSGEVSTYQTDLNKISDRQWRRPALRFIQTAQVPVVPVYFHGTNSRLFHILSTIHPVLRTLRLPSELFNKRNKVFRVRIGSPITLQELSKFEDLELLGRYLRAKTYALGSSIEVPKFFSQIKFRRSAKIEEVAPPQPHAVLTGEFESIEPNYLLFQQKDFKVFCAPSGEIPHILQEIGRLREITFREVGEGTNRSIDLDEYDLYYYHLIIWDDANKKIVGAYRVGKGKDILAQYGKSGFYITSLFRISDAFVQPVLSKSLELGRSFIVSEYQRKPLSLFLLWKGILYYLLKNPDYRYLIGPVSISNDFSKFSKSLIVECIRQNYLSKEYSNMVRPKKRFKAIDDKNIDIQLLFEESDNDISKLDNHIKDIEHNLRIPVLLKKYLSLNAKIIAFNIDPQFNDCLDGLILLDLFEVPENTVKSLSKELDDESVMERFNLNERIDLKTQ